MLSAVRVFRARNNTQSVNTVLVPAPILCLSLERAPLAVRRRRCQRVRNRQQHSLVVEPERTMHGWTLFDYMPYNIPTDCSLLEGIATVRISHTTLFTLVHVDNLTTSDFGFFACCKTRSNVFESTWTVLMNRKRKCSARKSTH